MICLGNAYNLCSPSQPITSFESLFGSSWDGTMFDAFMTKDNNMDGMFAFDGDYVAVIGVDSSDYTHWTLHPKESIRTHPIWKGAPTGIRAATWIGRLQQMNSLIISHAVLFTDMHVYIYRINDTSVILRDQICT